METGIDRLEDWSVKQIIWISRTRKIRFLRRMKTDWKCQIFETWQTSEAQLSKTFGIRAIHPSLKNTDYDRHLVSLHKIKIFSSRWTKRAIISQLQEMVLMNRQILRSDMQKDNVAVSKENSDFQVKIALDRPFRQHPQHHPLPPKSEHTEPTKFVSVKLPSN